MTVARSPALGALLLPLGLPIVLSLFGAARARAEERCIECHAGRSEARLRAPVIAAADDVHAAAGVGCAQCHGGDPEDPSARAHDLGGGFRGVPDAAGVAILCGTCHDGSHQDAAAVLDAFRQGAHARATAAGRAGAASCTSCHRAHGITHGDDPAAPTAYRRIVDLCASCHDDPAHMAASGLPTDQSAAWRVSVHGRAALGGERDAPVCTSCHDPHRGESGLVATDACGRCHADIRAAFDRGPHADAFARLGFVDCAECHGSHEVELADARLLEGLGAACARCHGEGQPVFERVRRLAGHASELDAARRSLPRGDPRRAAMISAVHALDVDGLAAALGEWEPSGDAAAPERSAGERAHAPPSAWRTFSLPIGAAIASVVLALLVFVALRRKR
jgi:hypothetical protein